MVLGDTGALEDLLAPDFTLTHMTGFLQPKQEWLAAVDADEMQYHRIRDVETTFRSGPDGDVLVVRTMTDATIWGSRGDWRLQLELQLRPADEQSADPRSVARMVASTW